MVTQMSRKNLKAMFVLGVLVLTLVEVIKVGLVLNESVETDLDQLKEVKVRSANRSAGLLRGVRQKGEKVLKFKKRVTSSGKDDDMVGADSVKKLDHVTEKRRNNESHEAISEKKTSEEIKLISIAKNATLGKTIMDKGIKIKVKHGKTVVNDGEEIANSHEDKRQALSGPEEIFVNTSRPVLNPHPFKYLINSPDVCKGTRVFLLCYVHTAVKHVKRRKRIRQTWGNRTNYPGVEMRVVFFVGLPPLNTSEGRLFQDYLSFEAKRHGDIVQEDFLDTYQNLSHKGVGALKWIATYCNNTDYVLKTDDDMFVNMYIILNHLQNLYRANFRTRLIMCYVFWIMHVDRKGGQWSLTKEYFPSDVYPPYCSGMGFVASIDVAVAMYRVSPYVRFLWVDDAFISGVLPAGLEGAVNHTTWARTYCGAFEMGVYVHPTEWYKYTFTHVHNETLNLLTWEGLSEIVRNRTIPRPSVIRPGLLADEYIPLHTMFKPPEDR